MSSTPISLYFKINDIQKPRKNNTFFCYYRFTIISSLTCISKSISVFRRRMSIRIFCCSGVSSEKNTTQILYLGDITMLFVFRFWKLRCPSKYERARTYISKVSSSQSFYKRNQNLGNLSEIRVFQSTSETANLRNANYFTWSCRMLPLCGRRFKKQNINYGVF